MTNYGFEIVQTLIVDIDPVETVKRAMNEINAGNHSLPYLIQNGIQYIQVHHQN